MKPVTTFQHEKLKTFFMDMRGLFEEEKNRETFPSQTFIIYPSKITKKKLGRILQRWAMVEIHIIS